MSRRQLERSGSALNFGDDDSGCNVLHVDMDAFFAMVEVRDRPELKGKPVVVGRGEGRGVVLSATYEARAMGVHSAMPVGHARRACPNAIFVEPSRDKYLKASREVMTLLCELTPVVEVVSVDEAFLDVRSVRRAIGSPTFIAQTIRERICSEMDLTCSVGVAPVTLAAKLASTAAKPDGLLVVPAERMLEFLHGLPIGQLWGVGARTETQLTGLGIVTVGDLAQIPLHRLQRTVGRAAGERLMALAGGNEVRPIRAGAVEKSIGSERTFDHDQTDNTRLERELRALSDGVARRLRDTDQVGAVAVLKVRYDDFATVTRSHTLAEPSQSAAALFTAIRSLWRTLRTDGRPIRLIGVRVERLADVARTGEQLSLDRFSSQLAAAESAVDQVSAKFGPTAVIPARLLRNSEPDR